MTERNCKVGENDASASLPALGGKRRDDRLSSTRVNIRVRPTQSSSSRAHNDGARAKRTRTDARWNSAARLQHCAGCHRAR